MRVPLDEANVSLGLQALAAGAGKDSSAAQAPPLLAALHPNRHLLALARGPVLSVLPVLPSEGDGVAGGTGASGGDPGGNGERGAAGPAAGGGAPPRRRGGGAAGASAAGAAAPPQASYTLRSKEDVTALAWLCVLTGSRQLGAAAATVRPPEASELLECDCLLVGTAGGCLELHDPGGRLLFRQRLHAGPVAQICVRTCVAGLQHDNPTEDVTLAFPDAIARLAVHELRTHLKLLEISRQSGGSGGTPPLAYHRWELPSGFGARSGAACLGPRPRGLDAALAAGAWGSGRGPEHRLLIATAGAKPPLAGVEVEEQPARGALARLAGVAGSVTSAAYGAAYGAASKAVTLGPSLLTSGVRSLTSWVAGAPSDGARPPAVPSYDLAGAPKLEASLPWRPLIDDARRLGPLAPAPAGGLFAAADGLGRVLLVDGASMAVLRMWKGYRDAQCGWALPPAGHPWAAHGLLLVLYAPRRQLIEVWTPRAGARVAAARADAPCRLLPAGAPCGGWRNELMARWLRARGAPSTLVLRLGGRERGGVWDVLDLAWAQ
ncbi:MAG: Rab3 GTPase-activating protein regulatory subunit N-terminus-domain-containing protein [Monoraphidium minutum]|nr:MAG: Rab3 GTPase-activating protein regulatory subunit N-terminus-domain-containing protein [Monoraphidium minutum]